MRTTILSAVMAFTLGLGVARAEEPQARWYGWQLMLADVAAGTIVLAAADVNSEPALLAGAGLFYTAGPAVHVAHGHAARGLASAALRASLTLGAAGVAGALCEDGGEVFLGCSTSVAMAAFAGAVVAMTIDYAALAHERPRAADRPGVALGVAPRRGGLAIGIGGAF